MPHVHPDLLRSGDTEAIRAAEALIIAQTCRRWGQKDLSRHKKLTSRLIRQLELYDSSLEVAKFLRRLKNDPTGIDSRELHYIQRRYLDQCDFKNAEDLDALYEHVLQDPEAQVYRAGGIRYQVRSLREGWIAIVEPDGTRVSIYPDLNDDFGEPLWSLNNLI